MIAIKFTLYCDFPMTKILLMILSLACISSTARSQSPNTIDGTLNTEVADQWARLVLKGVDTEFPNKLSLVYSNVEQIQRPSQLFPAFYGCFDWHSSVHGHWVLVRLLKNFPEMKAAEPVRDALKRHLTKENLEREAAFFAKEEQKSFERMYGWAWFLRLAIELGGWDDADAKTWRTSLQPLESVLVDRILAYLPLLTYPIRTGEHADTAFALGQILDYARATKHQDLEALVLQKAREFYSNDRDYPVHYEPSGHDFFSSCWNEADLMRRVLPGDEFAIWLDEFLPKLTEQLVDGTISPVRVSDITDGKLVHLAGLNLNRSWCMRDVSDALPDNNQLKNLLAKSATNHRDAGLAYINSGHYEGDHWLATFGLYATKLGDQTRN